jgi:hypothetical protein
MGGIAKPGELLFVGASGAAIRLAGEGALKDAFAGKPGSYIYISISMSQLPATITSSPGQ